VSPNAGTVGQFGTLGLVMANSAWPLELQPLDLIGQRDDARRQGVNGEGERVQLPSFGVADHYRLNSLVGLGRICGNCS